MCGIAGMWGKGAPADATIRRMTARLHHRGPDDEGIWNDAAAGIALGHRRLSLVDLSANGHQPMVSLSGRLVLTFNGEIYNHAALRRTLDRERPHAWRGHSDSETLLEAIDRWGLAETLRQCAGMFALALWDRRAGTLHLARDRFGEKPLYYGRAGGDFVFASELKAIRAHPGFVAAVDRGALGIFAARGYVPAPLSIYAGIRKLEPGTILSLGAAGGDAATRRYWCYRDVVEDGLSRPFGSELSALRALEDALVAAIAEQSAADVPVGAFLSGGIDSSLVVALWTRHLAGDVRTYTIGFEEGGFDEAPHARKVADRLGTRHSEHYVTSREARDVIPLLPQVYDEPFADPSQIPTYLISRLARQDVKTVVSGDGGDELFGGYTRYRTAERTWRAMRRVPMPLRRLAGRSSSRVLAVANGPTGVGLRRTVDRFATATDLAALYRSFRDEWTGEPSPVIAAASADGYPLDLDVAAPDIARMMYCDAVSYLPDDVLCKVDRAAMAHGLEVRMPFLDHRVAAVAARIPVGMKVHGGAGKQILRRLLFEHLPVSLFARPKAGFSVPVGAWLKGPLKPWASALLARDRLDRESYFDGAAIERRWREHLSGRRDATYSLWPVLMFGAWNEQQQS